MLVLSIAPMCKKTLQSIYGMHIILTFCFTLIRICDRFFAIFSMHHISEQGTGKNLISRRHKLLKHLQKSYLISYNEVMDISMTIWFYISIPDAIYLKTIYATNNIIILIKSTCIAFYFIIYILSCVVDNKLKTCGSTAIRVYQ